MTTLISNEIIDSKPYSISLELNTSFQDVLEVPDIEIPRPMYNGQSINVDAVAEMTSPIILSNISANNVYVDIAIQRNMSNTSIYVVKNLPIPQEDVTLVPIQGQFLMTGDILKMKSSEDESIHMTVSYTLSQME